MLCALVADVLSLLPIAEGFPPDFAFTPDFGLVARLLDLKPAGPSTAGHFLAVFGIPLGFAGLFSVHRELRSAPSPWRELVVFLAGFGLALAISFHGSFAFGAQGVGEETFRKLVEPLAFATYACVLASGAVLLLLVAGGKSSYSRWTALISPLPLHLVLGGTALAVGGGPGASLYVTMTSLSLAVWFGVTVLQAQDAGF